ncbi:FixH family protein [Pseudoponticoccus marisrubri]|uniref:Nitrogen fixation protein FixH n=1 Tax=Pseudoponticoccus marisrubri TaxID=1685382 RepID=A0A0W7WPV9_9RHOB|nr:FixH family protein [Pseudoponticoccus marisrubri]KUF12621.1 nitrogen fixation protein FixH [Pseudoponticoccus marisrubri]
MSKAKEFKLTGWHALGIFGGAFAIIISVNVALAVNAVRTFPGVETDNSYVASQTFDDRRAAQEALGWDVSARLTGGLLILEIRDDQGRAVEVEDLDAVLGRPTHVKDDRSPDFRFDGRAYVARESLAPGNWNIRMTARAEDGTPFEQRVVFHVKN